MVRFDYIKNLNDQQFTDWLYEVTANEPWDTWFDDTYCKHCEPIIACYTDSDREMDFAYCELYDKCCAISNLEHAPSCTDVIKLWLNQEVEE